MFEKIDYLKLSYLLNKYFINYKDDFINMLNIQNLINLWECDKITNEIYKAFYLT